MRKTAPPAPLAKILGRKLTRHRSAVIPQALAAGTVGNGPPADPADDPAANPAPPRIDPTGGKFGAGIIRGVSVTTLGEALGHGEWLDATFLAQTLAALAADPAGKKSRFAHPGLSADGLGTHLGRITDGRMSADGQAVLGDLHFDPSAHATPDGDLAAYLMGLAQTDPAAFGTSIVYHYDTASQDAFAAAHSTPATDPTTGQPLLDDDTGEPLLIFRSPDPGNVHNYPHPRLAKLDAIDAVDSPAANPSGLFSADTLLDSLDALAAYAVGLTTEPPAATALDADPDRIREYLARFLAAHNLTIAPAATPPALTWDEMAATLAKYAARFGAQRAQAYLLTQKLDWPAAIEAYAADLENQQQTAATRYASESREREAEYLAALAALKTDHAAALAAMTKERDDLAAALAIIPKGLATPLSQADPTLSPAAGNNGSPVVGSLSPSATRYALSLKLPGLATARAAGN